MWNQGCAEDPTLDARDALCPCPWLDAAVIPVIGPPLSSMVKEPCPLQQLVAGLRAKRHLRDPGAVTICFKGPSLGPHRQALPLHAAASLEA
jgi:hypothetical protein